ncbi:acyl-CoA dehydrogenase family protein [Pseudobacteriovorax antillogorgiicola]|uniref:Cyclohexane-1-carbonyl-CoA dehydrogenase n=1 Tax=Pseudobacteriovorax antillogorgiicola TaxID=1513793 RepID=A0A1Y6CBE6_9BACT|nr:acyl-CoA dehydrogenase family protein [Pseudobacteriovorax antillogorgiicola]TCS49481.1 alkylation response protein AidB-like acyl-CoA dehydrogenase [Pseudobacteriovorax antillogorgiicola]SMF46105.1 Acyl-CoA dehydrogenase [Pseudobacteriovorax antillogorgiicola]
MSYSFADSEEIKMLRESVRDFAEKEIAPKAHDLDENEEFSVELTKKMGELGLFGTVIPAEYGGQGMDYIQYVVAVEELARVDGSHAATIAAHNSLGAAPLYYYGNEEQKKEYLPSLCDGNGLWAFGLTEADAGSDAQASKTKAEYDAANDEWVINGSKIWITNSASELTKGITVQAITGKRDNGKNELSCFIVPADAKGLTRKVMHGKMMWRASNTGELYFDNVRVPNSAMLGNKGEGFKQMMETLDNGRLSIGAMGLGLAKGALDLTIKYANERQTFGKPIAKHQAVAFKLAEMATRIEAAEGLLYKAAWLKQEGRDFQKHAAMAKLYCSEVAEYCAREGQQTFGGYGLMKEYPIERHYRDAALLRIGEGTSEIQRLVISRYIGC